MNINNTLDINIIIDENKIKINKFICNTCNKEFKYNSHYQRHINNKIKCITINKNNVDISEIININELNKMLDNINHKIHNRNNKTSNIYCGYCNKEYSTKNNLKRHILKSCNEKNKIMNKKEEIMKQIKIIKLIDKNKEDIKIENKYEKDNATINNTTNNINNGTINNTNHVNIVINNFGSDDISHLTQKDFITYINKMYDGLLKLIEDVNFSEKNTNNYNVYLTSIRNEFANIYENNKWKLKDVNDVIEQLKDDKLTILDKHVEELKDDKLKNTLETFKGRLIRNAVADKNLNKNIKLVMVNNSDKIIKHKKINTKKN